MSVLQLPALQQVILAVHSAHGCVTHHTSDAATLHVHMLENPLVDMQQSAHASTQSHVLGSPPYYQ
jgi:hypothetical protein